MCPQLIQLTRVFAVSNGPMISSYDPLEKDRHIRLLYRAPPSSDDDGQRFSTLSTHRYDNDDLLYSALSYAPEDAILERSSDEPQPDEFKQSLRSIAFRRRLFRTSQRYLRTRSAGAPDRRFDLGPSRGNKLDHSSAEY